jgi:hypothetical protein
MRVPLADGSHRMNSTPTAASDWIHAASFSNRTSVNTTCVTPSTRATAAALPAITDALGAVPVIGSALDGVLTFVIEFVEGGDS